MVLFKKMRKFHNQIKLKYLTDYIIDKTKLLDLASGKGGDILKWNNNKMIVSVDGYDINEESVKEAIRRRKISKIKKRMTFKVVDLSSKSLDCLEKYEVITSMFAFHYFFKSKESLNTIFKTIDNCSKKGTIIIMTLFDGNRVEDIESKNFYLHTFKDNDKRRNTGNKLEVFIKESVLDKPEIEYIVDPKFLISIMKKHHFNLVEKKDFEELYNDSFKLNSEEQRLSFLNTVYVFKRM